MFEFVQQVCARGDGLEPRPLDSSSSALHSTQWYAYLQYLTVSPHGEKEATNLLHLVNYLHEGAGQGPAERGGVICGFTLLYSTELDHYLWSSSTHPVGNDEAFVTDLQWLRSFRVGPGVVGRCFHQDIAETRAGIRPCSWSCR